MGHRPRVLICEHDRALAERLRHTLERAGFWADIAKDVREILQLNEHAHYDAMTLDLIFPDQDAVSLVRDLRILGLNLPVLCVSIRNELDAAEEDWEDDPRLPGAEQPEWVEKAAEQSRVIFAVKAAAQRVRGFRPTILHVESDPFSAGLVQASLRKCANVIQVKSAHGIDAAVAGESLDLALLNPNLADGSGHQALHSIAAAHPDLPVVLHGTYEFHPDKMDLFPNLASEKPAALGLIEALRSQILHSIAIPVCAQA